TITISSNKTALQIGETANITFTLSEASSDFIGSDITVAGGTLGTLSGSGSSYTAVFTPTANSTTTATFNVAAATFTDAAGNNNTAATQLSVAVDTTSPTITITSSASALKSGEIATITFTLSEAASDFAFGDIVVAGGALSALTIVSTTSYTAVFTPTTNSITTATFNVAAATFTDAVGNNNTAATQLSITVDTVAPTIGNNNTAASQFTINVDTTAPTITISSNKTALRIGETATLTFTLSEAASDFAVSDIVATGGALSTLTIVSTTSYTATFIPTTNSTTPAAINVAAAIFTDTAGNNNTAATQLSITVDTTAPTITISSNKTSLNLGETATLTFMLSEATSTALISSNITVVGGVLSNFAGAGTSYTATFTPTANSTTIATFNVLVNTFTDSPGNNNLASNTISLTVDTTAPAITIASDKTSLVTAQTATLTFTLSEPSANFSDTDIVSAGGTLSTLVGSGTSYTATFTPNTNSTTTATFNVAAAAFTDSASNANTAASQLSINIDTVALPPSPTPSPAPNPAPSPAPPRKMTASSSSLMTGVTSTVNLIDQDTGKQINSVIPFPGFSGELRIAMADVNHDGKMETIIAAGPGGGPAIMVMESETGTVLQTFFAFEPAFTGGIFVAIADFNTDGIMDIVVGAGSGGGPHIKIFDGLTQNVLRSFFAYQENFSGGVSVAATDINGDGFAELVTGAGTGGSSHVKVFNGKTFEIISQWYAYSSDFKGGVFVAVGDIGNNGKCEIVTGAGEGGGPVVAIWDPYTGALLNQFLAYDENFRGGARVGISDKNGDGIANLLTGAGPGGGPQVNGYSFPTLDLLFSFYSGNINNAGGVFVS
ncbi:MAG: Ig-like domain-containing protein, partial [Planctomycetota bacterium]|nr:Ig-like domain-containing protein [Planctomycetota bacterium]